MGGWGGQSLFVMRKLTKIVRDKQAFRHQARHNRVVCVRGLSGEVVEMVWHETKASQNPRRQIACYGECFLSHFSLSAPSSPIYKYTTETRLDDA